MKKVFAASIASLLLVTANASLAGDAAAGKSREQPAVADVTVLTVSVPTRCGRIWPGRKRPIW